MKTKISWGESILKAHRNLVKGRNTRELGKIRQHANEFVVQEWLNADCSGGKWAVLRHEEMTEEQFGELDHNCSGWDLIEPVSGMTTQAKYRAGKNEGNRWHMEQTRRTSGNNSDKAHNGQVRYQVGEFDVIIFTSPEDITTSFSSEDLIAIPSEELHDPKKPGFLVGRVPLKIVRKWRARPAAAVIREVREKILRRKLNE